jgi:hypothetical protein
MSEQQTPVQDFSLTFKNIKRMFKNESFEKEEEYNTWEKFYKNCPYPWVLMWLYGQFFPRDKRKLHLVKGLCANVNRDLIKDKRLLDSIDAAIAFGKGEIEIEEMRRVHKIAWPLQGDPKLFNKNYFNVVYPAAVCSLDESDEKIEKSHMFFCSEFPCMYHVIKNTTANAKYKECVDKMFDVIHEHLNFESWDTNVVHTFFEDQVQDVKTRETHTDNYEDVPNIWGEEEE